MLKKKTRKYNEGLSQATKMAHPIDRYRKREQYGHIKAETTAGWIISMFNDRFMAQRLYVFSNRAREPTCLKFPIERPYRSDGP